MDYRISVEETGEVDRNIKIEIPYEMYRVKFDSVLSRAAGQAQIKGFRPGHAPRSVVEKMYGDRIQVDVLNELIDAAFRDATKKHALKIVGSPNIDLAPLKDKEDIVFTAGVSVLPEPEIKNYSNLKLEVEVEEFSEDDVAKEIEQILEHFSKFEDVTERKVIKNKDYVELDYVGKLDGNDFQGSTGQGVLINVGAGDLEEFEKALLGAEVGQEKEIALTMPEDTPNPEIAGKLVNYQVKITGIKTRELPELDDEIAKKSGMGSDVATFKQNVHDNMERQVKGRNQQNRENALFQALAEKNTFQIPQAMVDEEIRSVLFESRVLDPNKRESFDMDMTPFRGRLGEGAEMRVRRSIMLGRIIDQEKIKVSDEDLDTWLEEKVKEAKANREDVNKAFGFPKSASRLKEIVSREKAIEFLFSSAQVKETKKKKEKSKHKH